MRRCNDCNRFVAIEYEARMVNLSIDESTLRAEASLVIECDKCDVDLADADVADSWTIDHPFDPPTHQLRVLSQAEPQPMSRVKDNCKWYGVSVDVELGCACGLSTKTTIELLEQAAEFVELW